MAILIPKSIETEHVNHILSAYALPMPVCWVPVENSTNVYRVGAGSAEPSHYLKCYSAKLVSREDVLAEIQLVNRLRATGVRVVVPVANRDGHWITPMGESSGEGCAVLFEKAEGERLPDYALSGPQCAAFGQLAARAHCAMDAIPHRHPYRRMDLAALADTPLQELGPFLSDPERSCLAKVVQRVKELLAQLSASTGVPAYGLCHGDLYAGNVTFDKQDRPTLLDFQELEYGWRAYDLAQFLWRAGRSWADPDRAFRADRWEAFLGDTTLCGC